MSSAVNLFVGEEKYLLDQEVKRWRNAFEEKFGKDSVFSFMSENFDSARVLETIYAGGLFVQKKMVILNGIPADNDGENSLPKSEIERFTKEFLDRNCKVPDSVILLLVAYKPDKRLKLYKHLITSAKIHEFNPLRSVKLKLFVKEKLGDLRIKDEDIDYLLVKVGKNLYRLDKEIEKLQLRSESTGNKDIDLKTIDSVVFGQVEVDSFLFFDYFLTDTAKTVEIWSKIQEEGTDFNQALGMLYRGLKLYILMIDQYKQGVTDSKTMAQIVKYHPFAVSKNMKNIQKIMDQEVQIKKFFTELVELDYSIKIGKAPVSYFWLAVKKALFAKGN